MKTTISFLLILIFIHSYSQKKATDSQSDKITQTETNLISPVFIEGDSTWTITERMAHYGVPE